VTSAPLNGENRFYSPTLGEIVISPVIQRADAPSNFCREIFPISDNLCIAWSGSRIGAKAVVEDIRTHFGESEVTFDELNEFVKCLVYREAREVSLIGVFVNAGKVNVFCIKSRYFDDPLFGPVYVAGSGSEDFKSILGTYQSTKDELETSDPLAVAGGMCAGLLTLEAVTGRTLKQRYGGGFECVTFQSGKFHRLPEVTFVFWRIGHKDKSQVVFKMLPTILKLCYREDDLIIRRTMGVSDEHAPRPVKAISSLFTIPSLLGVSQTRPIGVDELPNLNSQYTFHGFLIERSPKNHVVFGYGESKLGSITFRNERNTIRCSLSAAFKAKINEIGNRFWNSHIK